MLRANLKIREWWEQFPSKLRLITKARLLASIGAGGVIYLTPLIFNQINFSASQIGIGIASAALIGTFARILIGILIDRGTNYLLPLKVTSILVCIADLLLFNSYSFAGYLQGQLLIGLAAGLYWPAIEVGVSSCCGSFPSGKGYALARSADALGISLGALLGSIGAYAGLIRAVYITDIGCMFMFILIISKPNLYKRTNKNIDLSKSESIGKLKTNNWIIKIIPILLLSLIATTIFSLLQSALPIDLARGTTIRAPLNEAWSSSLIAIQLGLLVIIQWPIGYWVSKKKLKFGLGISILNFGLGCFLIGISAYIKQGVILILLAQFPLAIGLASFLPTATEGIIREAPMQKKGFALALYSQCFAISAFFAPLISGLVIDKFGNAIIVWTTMSAICFIALIPMKKLDFRELRNHN